MNSIALRVCGWELLNPYGDKRAWQEARATNVTLRNRLDSAFGDKAHTLTVPDFDVRVALGMKGTRTFDRHTGLFVKSAGLALAEAALDAEVLRDAAIINGTAAGSLSSILDFLLDTYRNEKPYFVNPGHMPNTVINCAAGQCAIWHGIKGANATVSAGAQSFFAAARLAARWARQGYTRHFVIGAVEEITPIVSEVFARYRARTRFPVPLAEGAATFVCEATTLEHANGNDNLLLATRLATAVPGELEASLRRLIRQTLDEANLDAADIALLCGKSPYLTSCGRIEAAVASKLCHQCVVPVTEYFGHGNSVSGAMQIALLLDKLPSGAHGLAISASRNGSLACCLVRKGRQQ